MKALIKKIIPQFFLNWYHLFLAFTGAIFYHFPSRQRRGSPSRPAENLKVIGITGTNGKTTTVELTKRILEEEGFRVASVSSIKFQIGKKEWRNEMRMTMPGRFFLQRFLRKAVNADCDYAVLEVTSEGIKQHRHRFIDFNVAVFTNLAPEHIESHGSFEKYREAKGKLFQATKKAHAINLDDENANYFLQFPADEKWGYIMNSEQRTANSKDLFIVHCSLFASRVNGISFDVQDTHFDLNLLGRFNAYNALAAICVGLSQGIDLKTCKRALEKIKTMPGRMEVVIKEPFKVIVDYAFTPNALQKVYETLSGNSEFRIPKSKMICVFGACGGGRDKWKRPVLGKIAAEYCDRIILTNEDPYNENPLKIIENIESGFSQIPNGAQPKAGRVVGGLESKFQIPKYEKILDRREAVRKALSLARTGDMVVITGKGSEPSICVAGGKQIPWDDRQVVREEFEKSKQ